MAAEKSTPSPIQRETSDTNMPAVLMPAAIPFAGRLGGNQAIVLNPNDPAHVQTLSRLPDASPFFTLKQGLDLRGFADVNLWRFAIIECIGTMILVFTTAWPSAHTITPPSPESSPTNTSGVYGTPTFLAPLVGAIVTWFVLTMCIYAFGSVTGAHLNPFITLATCFARLTTLPRAVLYIAAQTLGGSLAGWALRTAFGSSEFAAGGCSIDTTQIPSKDAFVLEFMYCLATIMMAFGVGLDPRQAQIIGATLSPFLVGLVVATASFSSSFTRPGYYGASLNPARCFGVYVGSSFPGYHWIHWVAPLVVSIGHGAIYYVVPPWQDPSALYKKPKTLLSTEA